MLKNQSSLFTTTPAGIASKGLNTRQFTPVAPLVPTTVANSFKQSESSNRAPAVKMSAGNNISAINSFISSGISSAGNQPMSQGFINQNTESIGSSLNSQSLQVNSQSRIKRGDVMEFGNTATPYFNSNPSFGIGMFGGMPTPKGDSRSGLMNLQMKMKAQKKSVTQEYTVKTTKDKGDKSILIQDNFIESSFSSLKDAMPQLKQPLWATGLDHTLDFPSDLISKNYKAIDGINRIAGKYNPPTKAGQETILNYQANLESDVITVEHLYQTVRSKLASYFDLPEGTGIFLAPSEATAQLMVLMIANALNPEQHHFHSILTGKLRDEIDSSILNASEGKFISSDQVPNIKLDGNEPLEGYQIPELNSFSSQILEKREEDNSDNDYNFKLLDALDNCNKEDKMPIIQSMGPFDQHMEELWYKNFFKDNFKVYNHLVGRVNKEDLHKHLKNEDLFILNGADFYRGPLQCAAVFVPSTVMECLRFGEKFYADNQKKMWRLNEDDISYLNLFFSKDSFPEDLKVWRDCFEDLKNPGLGLRWMAAVSSMAQLSEFTDQELEKTEQEWKQQMTEMLKLVPVLEKDNYYASDISQEEPYNTVTISIQNQDKDAEDQKWLSRWDLSLIQHWMSEDMSEKIDWEALYPNYEDLVVGHLSKVNIDQIKEIASQKIYLAPPIEKPMAEKNGDGALQITLGFEELTKMVGQQSDTEKINSLAHDATLLYKLSMLGYAYPQLVAQMSTDDQKASIKNEFMDAQIESLKNGFRGFGEGMKKLVNN